MSVSRRNGLYLESRAFKGSRSDATAPNTVVHQLVDIDFQ
jgi:hypothetical protein